MFLELLELSIQKKLPLELELSSLLSLGVVGDEEEQGCDFRSYAYMDRGGEGGSGWMRRRGRKKKGAASAGGTDVGEDRYMNQMFLLLLLMMMMFFSSS